MNALLIVVLVAGRGPRDPETQGAVRAMRELLGSEAHIEVRSFDEFPSDEAALALGNTLSAQATIELSWETEEHRRARIRFHLAPRAGFTNHLIEFERADDPSERGRTIGYALASMLPQPSAEQNRRPPFKEGPSQAAPILPETATRPIRETETHRRPRGSIDVSASTALTIAGTWMEWGGSASGRWYFARQVALRLGAGLRTGQVEPAQATSTSLNVGLGLAWLALPATPTRGFELGGRLGLLAIREEMSHFDSDDTESDRRGRWLSGAEAALEGGWLFGPTAGLVGAIGTEVAFGKTDVTLHFQRVATIPPVRLFLQAGVRATF